MPTVPILVPALYAEVTHAVPAGFGFGGRDPFLAATTLGIDNKKTFTVDHCFLSYNSCLCVSMSSSKK